MKPDTISIKVGEEQLVFETGKIARQANATVIVTCGETMVMASACASKSPKTDVDFFPFTVHYQEKFSSAGKTLGGYLKREGRPTERETLISRLIDRPLRPMFENGYQHEVQVISYVLSFDMINSPDHLAICASSAALAISDIPLIKPIGAVRVGHIDGKFVVNPKHQQLEDSKLDLVIAGTEDAVLMIEGYCNFFTEEQVMEAITLGHQAIQKICHALKDWSAAIGKPKNRSTIVNLSEDLIKAVKNEIGKEFTTLLTIADKIKRETETEALRSRVLEKLSGGETPAYKVEDVKKALKKAEAYYMREMILTKNLRCDGRNTTTVRQINVEQHILPRAHGSSLFTRGETQSLAVCTLGGEAMAQRYEELTLEGKRRFYLQYFFPPFSVGETGRVGPPGRREVGHGKLAERSLSFSLPDKEKFPYTIRLESNIMESNGSSSMASVCGACLAMMDAGVPIKRPVAGIAMGLILEDDRHAILSDILGVEDSLGDMDFKIAGDHEGITAFQMDIKIEGITLDIMKKALEQAKNGRIHILDEMLKAAPQHRSQLSEYAPKIAMMKVKPSQIGTVIGPGGKQIRAIVEETGVEIDIDDDGIVSISSTNQAGIDRAMEIVHGLTAEVEEGKIYHGKVVKITDFGAFLEVLPGKEGLMHISEYDFIRVEHLDSHLREGDKFDVKVLEINDRGQLRLSRKALLPKPEGYVEPPASERRDDRRGPPRRPQGSSRR